MKKQSKIVEQNIIKGLVLDEKGNWISIAEKIEKENAFLKHLEAGEILENGKWISIFQRNKKHAIANHCVPSAETISANSGLAKEDATAFTGGNHQDSLIFEDRVTESVFKIHPEIEAEEETKIFESPSEFTVTNEAILNRAREIALGGYPQVNIGNELSKEYLEETMALDLAGILEAAKMHDVHMLDENDDEMSIRSWNVKGKRNQVVVFAVSIIIAIVAAIGTIAFAFIL
jgi:hypothetical protein